MYTITLADGRQLTGLGKNGDNFVSLSRIDETIFSYNLSTMTISDGQQTEILEDMVFIQQQEWADGSFYLAFRPKTELEKVMEAIKSSGVPSDFQASQIMTFARSMAARETNIPDNVALSIPDLLPEWSPDMGAVTTGQLCRHENTTYRCKQDHTPQAGWEPPAVPALWAAVELSASGTQSDPIPAARGMEYTYGLYYKDPEDGNLYLCQRIGESDGGKIILQFLPHELIGHYFTAV